jgi:hypothetical protein
MSTRPRVPADRSPRRRARADEGAPGLESLEPRRLLAADLAGTLAFTPGTLTPGSVVEGLTVREVNTGDEPAGAAVRRIVLSTDAVFGNADDVTLATLPREDALAPGATLSTPVSATIPTGLNNGRYLLILRVDAEGQVGEGNETNNTFVAASSPLTLTRNTLTVQTLDRAAAERRTDPGRWRIVRTGPTGAPLTVRFAVSGTASPEIDYASLGTSVTIPAGKTFVNVTLTPINDTRPEDPERAVLTLQADPAYALGSVITGRIDIIDDDDPRLSVTASDATAGEGDGSTGAFTITRTGSTAEDLAVGVSIAGTATSGSDYTPIGTTIIIPAGSSSATVLVSPLQDTIGERSETVVLTIEPDPDYSVIRSRRLATVVIADDEPAVSVVATDRTAGEQGSATGTYRVTRTGPTTDPLTVLFTMSGTSGSGDYVSFGTSVEIPAGATFVDLTLTPVDDAVVEAAETAILTLAAGAGYRVASPSVATVTITDNEPTVSIAATRGTTGEGQTQPGVFTITRAGSLSGALSVPITISGTATAGVDYETVSTTVVIPDGQASAAVLITPLQDTLGEALETVTARLASSTAYTLNPSRTSATVSIADDEPLITVRAVTPAANEQNAAAGRFTVTRSVASPDPLTVTFTLSGTATSGSDFEPIGTTVTIPANAREASITLTPIDDSTGEERETVILTLTGDAGYRVNPASASATVSIADNEPAVSVSASDASASELPGSGGPDVGVFTVSRPAASPQELTVVFTISGTAESGVDFTPITTTVVIPANAASATVTVTPIQDALGEGTETAVLTLASGTGYVVNDARKSAAVNIADDEPVLSIAATDATMTELDQTTATFTITRTGPTTDPLTVSYAVGGTADPDEDYDALDGEVVFAAGSSTATITVAAVDDDEGEFQETIILTLEEGPGWTLNPARTTATANLLDNEPVITVTAGDAAAGEAGGNTGLFSVSRGAAVNTEPLTVSITITGTATMGTDFETIETSVTIPAGSATAPVMVRPIADLSAEPAETVILTVVSAPGYRADTSRGRATVTIADAPAVDLTPSALTFNPGTGFSISTEGPNIPVSLTVSNLGDTISASFAVQLRLSLNTTWGDDDDIVLTSTTSPGIVGRGSAGVVLDIPWNDVRGRVAVGDYFVAARVDFTGSVPEVSELNNTFFTPSALFIATA